MGDSLAPALAWLVFVPLLLLKRNRTWQAWLVFAPLLVVHAVWGVVNRAFPLPSSTSDFIGAIIGALAMGLAVLWLWGAQLMHRQRLVCFVRSAVVMAVIIVLSVLSRGGSGGDEERTIYTLISAGMLGGSLLAGWAVAGFCCRRRYTARRFVLWVFVWCLVCSVLCCAAVLVVDASRILPSDVWRYLLRRAIVGVVSGVGVFLVSLPFLILARVSPLYRERLHACLRLPGMSAQTDATGETEADEGLRLPREDGPEETT